MQIEEIVALSGIKGLGNASLLNILRLAQSVDSFSITCQQCQVMIINAVPVRLTGPLITFFEKPELRLDSARQCIDSYRAAGITLISLLDAHYPDALRRLAKPPSLLYCRGNIALLAPERQRVAVIGTRTPTQLGKGVTKTITKALSAQKKIIVSGLAIGIDSVAHEETLRQRENTIAVVVDVLKIYPATNKNLAKNIINTGGLIISENPPGTRISQGLLVQRDRIQAALSERVYAIECREKGGTLHAINVALTLNIPVCAPQYTDWDYADLKVEEIQGLLPLLASNEVEAFSPNDELH
ncbi:DNA-processing protein DprA [Alteromonas sp. BMJM2]|uniref:DNA-processing protein DprA n=1 Tax=Alteromonas sp. BMJM2 TaxID=2954241 RepID=UPI0022B3C6F6|nr:DNA-processing protein DprA [Alteromonas sp. BMJM2]